MHFYDSPTCNRDILLRRLLFLATLSAKLYKTMNGIIWNKMTGTFVPISSIPTYAMLQHKRFKQSREIETHNFQLQNLTLTSFQENNFFEFYDNDTKITGICGELWNLLSHSLNFTLQLVKSNESSLGYPDKNGIYKNGLLNVIARNETTVIPKVETFDARLSATDFSMPLWMNKYRVYLHLESVLHDSTWMARAFSWQIWCIILIMYVLLSVYSFCSHTIITRLGDQCKSTAFGEHFFYNFGMLCKQSYIPESLDKRSRLFEVLLGLFCFVLHTAFGAVLFIYLTKSVVELPFKSLDTIVSDSKYYVVSLNGSLGDIAFQVSNHSTYKQVRTAKRNINVPTIKEMFDLACSTKGKKRYALFQSEDESKIRGKIICHLTVIGRPHLQMWIAAGIARNFKYKRTIDLGILKLKEVGLFNVLKERWLADKIRNKIIDVNQTKAIAMDQISLIIVIMCFGMTIAFIIFAIEKIVYAYKFK